MKANEILKEEMLKQEITQLKLINELGLRSQGSVSRWLNNPNLKVDKILSMLDVLDGELIIRMSDGEEYVIDE